MLVDLKKMDLSDISSFSVFLRKHDDDLCFPECQFVASGYFLDLNDFYAFVDFVQNYFSFDYYQVQIQKNHSCLTNHDIKELILNIEVYE